MISTGPIESNPEVAAVIARIVDLRTFRRRGFWMSVLTYATGFGAFFATLVILPLWPQQNMGYTATQAGYATRVMGIFAVLVASLVGKLTETVDPRLLGLDPRIFSLGRAYLADPPPHGAINTGAAY